VARLVVLFLVLAPALVIIHVAATAIVSLAHDQTMSTGTLVGDSSVLLLRGWLALLPFGAIGYVLGAILRRPMAGVSGAIAFLLLEGVAGAVATSDLEGWWSPAGNAAALVGAASEPDRPRAGLVTVAYVSSAVAAASFIVASRRRRLDHQEGQDRRTSTLRRTDRR
jgi:hypothetical protein